MVLRTTFMQIRHYCKPFVQLAVCYLMLATSGPVSLNEYIQPFTMSLVWGSCFFGKVLFKEWATYQSSANNIEFVFCFQPSIQWVFRWCKWPDSGTIQEDQWFSKCLLGMGWRRWWSLEQVSFYCLGLSAPSTLWDQVGSFCSVTCYFLLFVSNGQILHSLLQKYKNIPFEGINMMFFFIGLGTTSMFLRTGSYKNRYNNR